MSTDTLSEDRVVDSIGLVFMQRVTATSCGQEEGVGGVPRTDRPLGASDFWGVLAYPTIARSQAVDMASALVDFATSVLPVNEVVAVTYARERHATLVWTFIRRRDRAVRRQIYVREHALMTKYPTLAFDFNVVALDQIALPALVPDDVQGRLILYRPRE